MIRVPPSAAPTPQIDDVYVHMATHIQHMWELEERAKGGILKSDIEERRDQSERLPPYVGEKGMPITRDEWAVDEHLKGDIGYLRKISGRKLDREREPIDKLTEERVADRKRAKEIVHKFTEENERQEAIYSLSPAELRRRGYAK